MVTLHQCDSCFWAQLERRVPFLKSCVTLLWSNTFPLVYRISSGFTLCSEGQGVWALPQAVGFCLQNALLVTRNAQVILWTWVNCSVLTPLVCNYLLVLIKKCTVIWWCIDDALGGKGGKEWGAQWRFIGPGLWVLCCGFVFVSSGSGLGVCPELGMKNGLNQSRFHRDKLLSSVPCRILVTRLINWVIFVYMNDHSQCLTVL